MENKKEKYFQNLLKNLQEINNENGYYDSSFSQTSYISNKCIESAIDEIQMGMIQFKQTPDSIQQIIKMPIHKKIGDDIDQIDKRIKEGQQMLKLAKKQLLIHRKQEQQALKLQHDIKRRQNEEKTRQWGQQQKIFNQKRKLLFQKRQKQIQSEEQRSKQQQQSKKQQQLQQKKQTLEQRLRQMQQNRQKRIEEYESSKQQTKKIKLPKFKQIQKQYQKVKAEQNFQKQIIKKKIKLQFQLDHDLIKQHQKNYLQKMIQRFKEKGYSSQKPLKEEQKILYESRFKNLLKRSEEQIQVEREKFKRRIGFQERLKQIGVNVDDQKKIKIQIALDKAKNPLKYNFLKQKQLNDYQIYMQFKDFALDIDRNDLGNNYLQQSKRIGAQSRIKKSHSVSAISLKNKQEKQTKYRNYLQQLRAHRSVYSIQKKFTEPEVILSRLRRQSNRQKTIQRISLDLKKFDHQIKDKRNELLCYNTISTTIKKEREIDEMYMKSIKAKLACLQIQ